MAIAVYIHPDGVTTAQYDEAHRRLDEAGALSPGGRLHHSRFGPPDGLMVYGIWESPDACE